MKECTVYLNIWVECIWDIVQYTLTIEQLLYVGKHMTCHNYWQNVALVCGKSYHFFMLCFDILQRKFIYLNSLKYPPNPEDFDQSAK